MHSLTTRRLGNSVIERRFSVSGATGLVPGVLWTRESLPGPAATEGPLLLLGHGGGSHGIATAAIDGPEHGERGSMRGPQDPAWAEMWRRPSIHDDMNADWRATLDALLALSEFDPRAVGYIGLSMGTMLGLSYVAADPRITVAVLGSCGLRGPAVDLSGIGARLAADAPKVTCPLLYHVQWEDERFDRDGALELFGMLGSEDKRLQATPGPQACP